LDNPILNAIAAQAAICNLRFGKAGRIGKIPTCESRFKTPEHTAQRGICSLRATGQSSPVAFSRPDREKP
jgi:hypothetical protein